MKRFRMLIYRTIKQKSIRKLVILFLLPFMVLVMITYFIFYFLGTRQLRKQNCDNASNMVVQLSQGLEISLSQIYNGASSQISDWNYYSMRYNIENNNPPISPSAYHTLYDSLSEYVSCNDSDILGIGLYINDGSIFTYCCSQTRHILGINFKYSNYSDSISNKNLTWTMLSTSQPFQMNSSNTSVLGLMSLMGTNESELNGFILFEIQNDVLRNMVEHALITPNSFFSVMQDGNILFEESNRLTENEKEIIAASLKDTEGSLAFTTDSYYYFYEPIHLMNGDGNVDLGIMAAVPVSEMLLDQHVLTTALFVIVLTFLFICILVYYVLSKIITEPVINLAHQLKQISKDRLDVSFAISGNCEIETIYHEVESLMSRIRNLITNLNQEMNSRRIAELNVLQEQINPHFLYNTLDTIYQLCTIGEIHEAQTMTRSLATFYRIGVSKGETTISLADEFTHTEMYLSILQTRFDDFDYEIDFPNELRDYITIKTILQPIVENAIYHGIRPKRERGLIRITAQKNNAEITIKVSDNGVGLSEKQLYDIRKSLEDYTTQTSGKIYGIRNVNSRIHLTFKGNFGISIDSQFDVGCDVTIRIPVITSSETPNI